ncbi:TPA: hypothetical protein ACRX2K_002266, partial [Klebsiella pneumoniae]
STLQVISTNLNHRWNMLKIIPADRIWKVAVSRLHLCQFQHSCLSWHNPISPKNAQMACSPCHVWLCAGSGARKILYEFCFIRNNAG